MDRVYVPGQPGEPGEGLPGAGWYQQAECGTSR